MPMIDDDKTRDQALKCIAQLMTIQRPEWEFNGCLAILRSIDQTRSVAQITHAAIWFAEHRRDQQTPRNLAEEGRHWRIGEPEERDEPTAPPPPPRLHEQDLGPIPGPERISELRAAIPRNPARVARLQEGLHR